MLKNEATYFDKGVLTIIVQFIAMSVFIRFLYSTLFRAPDLDVKFVIKVGNTYSFKKRSIVKSECITKELVKTDMTKTPIVYDLFGKNCDH
jgi:hypothetical protein